MKDLLSAHLQTSSTITGIAILIAVSIAIAAGKLDWGTGASIIAGGVAMIALPQNSAARTNAAQDTVAALQDLTEQLKKK